MKGRPDMAETELRNGLSWAVYHVTNLQSSFGRESEQSADKSGCKMLARLTKAAASILHGASEKSDW